MVTDGCDLAGRDADPRVQKGVEVIDVVGLDDKVRRVLGEGEPVAHDLDRVGVAVEE